MKRVWLFICLFVVFIFPIFSSGVGEKGLYNGATNLPYKPYVGFSDDSLDYYLFDNPALLASKKFLIQLPSVNVISFNLAKALKVPSFASAVSNMTKLKLEKNDLLNYLLGLAYNVGSGYSNALRADVGAGFVLDNFGFGIYSTVDVHSIPKSLDSGGHNVLNINLVPEVLYGLTASYGYRVIDNDDFTFDVGASIHLNRKSYIKTLDVDTIIQIANKTKSLEDMEARGGFGIPIDLSASLGFLDGNLKVNASITNLNGYYYMFDYPNIIDALTFKNGTDFYVMDVPIDFSAGLIYTPKFKYVNPTVYFSVDNVISFLKDDLKKPSPALELIRHANLRIKLDILEFATVNLGYITGYPQIGLSLGYRGNNIEFVYGYRESGEMYGSKSVDYLTFRFKFGYNNPNK